MPTYRIEPAKSGRSKCVKSGELIKKGDVRIGWIDKNVHGGLGVMADDLVAGAVTSLLLLLAVYFMTP